MVKWNFKFSFKPEIYSKKTVEICILTYFNYEMNWKIFNSFVDKSI